MMPTARRSRSSGKAREASLKADDGWLTVCRPVLDQARRDPDRRRPEQRRAPAVRRPAQVGVLTLDDGKASFRAEPGVAVTLDGKPFERGEIRSDAEGKPDVLAFGRFKLILLKRGDRHAIRLKDNGSELRENFAGLRWFPVAEDWKIEAKFVPHPIPSKITFDTIVGEQDVLDSPGYATFERDGKTYRLDAASQPDGRLWFVFRDATSGRTTPANARQLTTEAPIGDDGHPRLQQGRQPPLRLHPARHLPHRPAPEPPGPGRSPPASRTISPGPGRRPAGSAARLSKGIRGIRPFVRHPGPERLGRASRIPSTGPGSLKRLG